MAAERYLKRSGAEPQSPRPSGEHPLALDHVQVAAPVGCENAARRFYGELLGLPEIEKPAALAGRGGVWFALQNGSALHVGVVADGFTAAGKAHPGLRAADLPALRVLAERLAAAGSPVSWDRSLPDVLRFFTADPWGNRLELLAGS